MLLVAVININHITIFVGALPLSASSSLHAEQSHLGA